MVGEGVVAFAGVAALIPAMAVTAIAARTEAWVFVRGVMGSASVPVGVFRANR
jgi:hypothetical protein